MWREIMINRLIYKEYDQDQIVGMLARLLGVAVLFSIVIAIFGHLGVLVQDVEAVSPNRYAIFDTKFAPVLVLFSALFEEIIFRFFPVFLLVICFSFRTKKHLFVAQLVVLMIASVVFGYAHGGFRHIFTQGVLGMLMSLVFILSGGKDKKFSRALFFSTLFHFAYNLIIFCTLAGLCYVSG
jgi:membrane protease YdiL (CAAX protease family)